MIETSIRKKIIQREILYNYAEHKRINAHDLIDKKENTLLICVTTSGVVFGGFSTAGFSIRDEPEGSVAMLFSIQNG